jgi:hypothetical protein
MTVSLPLQRYAHLIVVHGNHELTESKVLAIVQASVVLSACSRGLGRTVEQVEAESLISLQKVC